MLKVGNYKDAAVKVYHGYGHQHDMVVYGHLFKRKPPVRKSQSGNYLVNIIHLIRLFFVKPLPGLRVQLKWREQLLDSVTEKDGFFKFEWKSEEDVEAGWHAIRVNYVDDSGKTVSSGEGSLFVPNSTQFGFISDIDDTVLISHSSTVFKRLRVLFTKNPRTRKPFSDVVKHYELLAYAQTSSSLPNPFFYVSSSEWNLYDDLNDFFKLKGLPNGVFLLNQVKQWFELWKTGKTKHGGKLLRILRIMNAFPKQQFILLGDNTQSDPAIYSTIAKRFPGKIFAVYINNVFAKNEAATITLLDELEQAGVHCCFHKDNAEAIKHSGKIGLLR